MARLPQVMAKVIQRVLNHPNVFHPELSPGLEWTGHLANKLGRMPVLGGNAAEIMVDYDAKPARNLRLLPLRKPARNDVRKDVKRAQNDVRKDVKRAQNDVRRDVKRAQNGVGRGVKRGRNDVKHGAAPTRRLRSSLLRRQIAG